MSSRSRRHSAGGVDEEDEEEAVSLLAVPIVQGVIRDVDVHRARALAGFCVLSIVLFALSIRIVPPAHIGVAVIFGSVENTVLQSGLNVVNPFASVTVFNTKTQLLYTENQVPTQEGMNVELDVSILYHADSKSIRDLFMTIGVNYEEILIKPEMQSAVRGLTSEVSAKALYTSGRAEIRDKLMDELQTKLKPRGIQLEDVLLKGIKLPKLLTDAIELKAQAEQESARMEFVLTKEQQEAERKKIEAAGVASFQKIVSEGISNQLLAWKGIEATEKISESTNAKIVIMGNTKSSLPVLMSSDSDGDNTDKVTNVLSGGDGIGSRRALLRGNSFMESST